MKITRTYEINSKTTVQIERTKKVVDDIAYADGLNIKLGSKTEDRIVIKLYVDGICKDTAYHAPHIITRESYSSSYDALKAKGVYARLGDAYLTEANYNKIMGFLAEIEAELIETTKFIEVKAKEEANEAAKNARVEKAAAEYDRLIKKGMCPKCGTWCYGDCEAH